MPWGPFRSFLSGDSSLLELKLVTTPFASLHFLFILDLLLTSMRE